MFSFDGGSASKVDDVTALPSRHKMADMLLWQRYDNNKMVAMRYYVLHLQQYSHRLNLLYFFSSFSGEFHTKYLKQWAKFPLVQIDCGTNTAYRRAVLWVLLQVRWTEREVNGFPQSTADRKTASRKILF